MRMLLLKSRHEVLMLIGNVVNVFLLLFQLLRLMEELQLI